MYQIKAMSTSLIEALQHPVKQEALLGQQLLANITHCNILTINERAKLLHNKDPLADILSRARDGSITTKDICTLNTRVVNSLDQAIKKAHPCAVYITSTHAQVALINDQFLEIMQAKGHHIHRLVASHIPKNIGSFILAADDLPLTERRALFSVAGNITVYNTYNVI